MINPNTLKTILVSNKITPDIEKLFNQFNTSDEIINYLIEQKIISEDRLYLLFGIHFEIPFINLIPSLIDNRLVKIFDINIIKENLFIPLQKIGNNLIIAFANPFNIYLIDELKKISDLNIIPFIATKSRIIDLINSIFQLTENIKSILNDIYKEGEFVSEITTVAKKVDLSVETSSIVKLVDMIIKQALIQRASDIHIEPEETDIKIRYRIDGVLYKKISAPINIRDNLISRIKVISGMDISEKRLPQDGRIKVIIDNKEIDIRVATSPTLKGEKIVMRLLEKSNLITDIDRLGIDYYNTQLLNSAIKRNNGIIIVSGPTGSGKTTTLYTILQNLNAENYNIVTIEEPVEYILENINQIEVNQKIGLTFASGLRAILRQDPDIILVGEIRDSDTARVAIRSALTGHLVFTTLHTNSSVGSLSRLLDMSVEPYLISSSVIAVIAQRLIRKLCNECKQPVNIDYKLFENLNIENISEHFNGITKLYQKSGCSKCNYTGYKGRTGIFEVLILDKEIRNMILNKNSTGIIKDYAIKKGLKTLKDSALEKLFSGITDFDEVYKHIFLLDEDI